MDVVTGWRRLAANARPTKTGAIAPRYYCPATTAL